ncbi:2-C-methyl-D-erythritol 4-phosphate cytidylyltransferase [Propionibacterium cyclohexanicum]|uniref:2-C-methyl-D-erythritol 4-phosphate cytidylyltransferase n=1 Tax=Propionibacterium cyclohexanicum TaxID=64702 RepID=A0A1H9SVE4_9ACTN|nr:2-C-methyl-D-erythritol 4-phosphate cytidylyltransferase [Propionibacterium cyclohexanicum]SER88980.1 2-C-methyl-D-erythritol 4-phosphate cytidylyltransferase [Propionibacterium cyclohexanicum]
MSSPEPVVAIVAAAGSGLRLGRSSAGGPGPKALRTLAGIPLVRRSVDQLIAGGVGLCVVVCRREHREAIAASLDGAPAPWLFAEGGRTRQRSVANGLQMLPAGTRVVLVHDAARPLVPAEVVARVIAAVRAGAPVVVPAIGVADSVRILTPAASRVVDRSQLRAVQTPQGFDAELLVQAHRDAHRDDYTDDAAVCEAAGAPVLLVEGSAMAMKITQPLDFAIAETLMAGGFS